MYKNILAAVDGSELSAKAARHGAELAAKLGARLTIFHVVPPAVLRQHVPSHVGNIHQDIVNEFLKQGREILRQTEEKLAGLGLDISTSITLGHPAEEICKRSKQASMTFLLWAVAASARSRDI